MGPLNSKRLSARQAAGSLRRGGAPSTLPSCFYQCSQPALSLAALATQVVNVTILAIESEKPDPRLEAWLGQTFAFFFKDTNSSLRPPPRAANFSTADVHAAVSHLDFCPLASGNLLDITVRARRLRLAGKGGTACQRRRRGRRMRGRGDAGCRRAARQRVLRTSRSPCRSPTPLPALA